MRGTRSLSSLSTASEMSVGLSCLNAVAHPCGRCDPHNGRYEMRSFLMGMETKRKSTGYSSDNLYGSHPMMPLN